MEVEAKNASPALARVDDLKKKEDYPMRLKDKYAVVGVGYTPQGRVSDRTSLSFHVEACANAIKDAGLSREDIDGLICYRHFPAPANEVDVTPYLVAQYLWR